MERMESELSELFRVMDRMRKAWMNVTPCSTLSKAQFGTLMVIAYPERMIGPEGEPLPPGTGEIMTMTALSRRMHQSLPALSQRVSALESLGYVERVPDPGDRRVTGVRATPDGYRVLSEAYRRFSGIMRHAVGYLGAENIQTLLHLLTRLAEGLEAAAADPDGACAAQKTT